MNCEQNLAEYNEIRNKVVEHLERAVELLDLNGDAEEIEVIKKSKEDLLNGNFTIVIVGEFSAGKSTFLNALMHKAILPSYSGETTATVNFLRHKDEAPQLDDNDEVAGVVVYEDGRTKYLNDVDVKTLYEYVATRDQNSKQTNVALEINHVDLFIDSKFLKNRVVLVDSPGLNGVAKHHAEITMKQIKNSHAGIFMFRTEQPGTATDFNHLEQLKKDTKNVFFVLNKIDRALESEGDTPESLVAKLKESYKMVFPDESMVPEIWPISARDALLARDLSITKDELRNAVLTDESRKVLEKQSLMESFENRLWEYLTKCEKTKAQLLDPLNKVENILKKNSQRINQKLAKLNNEDSKEELNNKKSDLEKELDKMRADEENIVKPIKMKMNDIFRDCLESLCAKSNNIKQIYKGKLESISDLSEIEEIEKSLEKDLERRYRNIASELDSELQEDLRTLIETQCYEYLADVSEKLIGIENDGWKFNVDKFEIKESNIQNILVNYDKECDKLRKEIYELEDLINAKDAQKIDIEEMERTLREKKADISILTKNKVQLESNYFEPALRTWEEPYHKTRKREGLWGFWNFLLGSKTVVDYKVQDNAAEIEHARKMHQDKMAKLQCEIDAEKEVYERLEKPGQSSVRLEHEMKELDRKMNRRREELEERRKKFEKDVREKSEKELRQRRHSIEEYVEDQTDDMRKKIKALLVDNKDVYQNIINCIITETIKDKILSLKQEIENVVQLLESDEIQRMQEIQHSNEANDKIEELMKSGAKIIAEIESSMKAEIQFS